MTELKTCSELLRWTASYHASYPARDDASYHVKFDLPHTTLSSRPMARMVIFEDGNQIAVVTCLSWKETWLIRKETKFGNNHSYHAISWRKMREVLKRVAKHFDIIEYRAEVRADKHTA